MKYIVCYKDKRITIDADNVVDAISLALPQNTTILPAIPAVCAVSEGEICNYLVQLIEYMRGQGADTISNPKTGETWTSGKEE